MNLATTASGESLERIERELTILVRRTQRVHLSTEGMAHSLERSAYAILGLLHDEGPLRSSVVAANFRVDPSTVSRQLAALQDAGLVVRAADPDDGRATRLSLTPRGRQTLQATRRARRSLVRGLLATWPGSDRDTFALLLERFNAGLDCIQDAASTPRGPGEPLLPVTHDSTQEETHAP